MEEQAITWFISTTDFFAHYCTGHIRTIPPVIGPTFLNPLISPLILFAGQTPVPLPEIRCARIRDSVLLISILLISLPARSHISSCSNMM